MCRWKLQKIFKEYKYRSVPWLLFNWNKSTVKHVSKLEQQNLQGNNDKHLLKVQDFFQKLYHSNKYNSKDVMKECYGFCLTKERSNIEGGGYGVFVDSGHVSRFSLVAFYPGTVYYPMEPIFFQSIRNPFILKCMDDVLIDGSNSLLSKKIFKSCAQRDRIGPYMPCDMSWLTDDMKNPLAVGQFVNNETSTFPANVIYQEFDIPATFPFRLLQYIPNVNFSARFKNIVDERDDIVRAVILIALRDIKEGEELYSSYFTQIQVSDDATSYNI